MTAAAATTPHDISRNLLQRLHAAMGEVDYIQKEKKQGMKYSIVSHDSVTAKVRPVLVKHGVLYYPVKCAHRQDGNRTEARITIRFCNVDEPMDFIDVETFGYGIDEQDKGPGKAISYAVKYAILKALGLETGDDPDEDQSSKHKPGTPSAIQPQAPQITYDQPAESEHPARAWAAKAKTEIAAIPSADAMAAWKLANKSNIDALAASDPNEAASVRGCVRLRDSALKAAA